MFHNLQMIFWPSRRAGPSRFLSLLLLGGLAACNGQAADGAADAGAMTGGTAGISGGGSAGTSSFAGGGTGGSNGSSCSMFQDDLGWTVSVAIINRTSQTIHVGQEEVTCNVDPLFQVEDGAGDTLASFGACRAACDAVMRNGTPGCPAICAFPSAVTLQPDEGTNLLWNGLYRQETSLPQHCFPEDAPVATSMCDRAVQISSGRFTFTAQAGTQLDCLQTTGACGECMTRGEGGCATSATISGTLLSAEVSVDLDASYGVGGGDVPGNAGGIGATVPVEIVFTD